MDEFSKTFVPLTLALPDTTIPPPLMMYVPLMVTTALPEIEMDV